MSKLTAEEKLRRYHSIYDQIYFNPRIHVHEISKNLRLPRNTVTGYLEHMYKSEMLFGPELRLKYYYELNEYMFLVKVDDPYATFDEVNNDPNIIYCSIFLGDWNIMIFAEKNYDPTHVSGYKDLIYKGQRHDILTPRTTLRDWKSAFRKMKVEASEFQPERTREPNSILDPPDWDEEEWKLFYEYKYDFRRKVTPVLRKNLISSDKFYQWIKDLPGHAGINLRFYPDGYGNYTHFAFLFRTQFPTAVVNLLSNLPTTPGCTVVDGGVLAIVSIKSDLTVGELSATTRQMKKSGMIEGFSHAIGIIYYIGVE